MSLDHHMRVPFVVSYPTKIGHNRIIAGREDTVSPFSSVLNRAEDSPLHTDVEGSQMSRLPQEKLLQFLEKSQLDMNLRLLKSLGDEKEISESVPDASETLLAGIIREMAVREASKYQQQSSKHDGSSSYEELAPIIRQASETYDVDEDLIRAVIKAESNFQPLSTSPKGARGLMQLMPDTAVELGVTDSYDPVENIMGGTRYLKGLLNRYQGNVPRALAAYNWGAGNVERNPDYLPRETRQYIARVIQEYQSAKV